jgi:hypothetical protein
VAKTSFISPHRQREPGVLLGIAAGEAAPHLGEAPIERQGQPAHEIDGADEGRVVHGRMQAHDAEAVPRQLCLQLLQGVLDLVIRVRVGEEAGTIEPALPRRAAIWHGQEHGAPGLEGTPDLREKQVALMDVLEEVEAHHGVEPGPLHGEPPLEVRGEEFRVPGRQRSAGSHGDPERVKVPVHPHHLTTAPGGLDRVHAVAAAHVEHGGVGVDVGEIPVVVLGVSEQMLGMDVLGALPRPSREPDG